MVHGLAVGNTGIYGYVRTFSAEPLCGFLVHSTVRYGLLENTNVMYGLDRSAEPLCGLLVQNPYTDS
jgi:hypothetical protein